MNEKTTPSKPRHVRDVSEWHKTTDVAVIGFGGAGSCAAIEAADAGSRVMIFEAASASGGSTALSSAEVYMGGNGGTRVQRECGLEDKSEDMYNYLMQAGGDFADSAKVKNYVDGSVDHFDWLVSMGAKYKNSIYNERAIMAMTDDCLLYTGSEKAWPYRDIAKPCPRGHNLEVEGDNGGPMLMGILTEQVESRDINVHYDSRALTLIVDDSNSVVGIVVRIDQQELNIKAEKGVILCAGGFVMNEEMLKKYAPSLLKASIPIGNPNDTGFGIKMGMSVGGAAINMHDGFVTLPYYPPSSLTYGILVNASGQRFINEDCYHGRVGYHCLQQPGDRIYLVFSAEDFGEYETQSYLNADIAGTGETLCELEEELGLPNGVLQNTVETYNINAAKGEDPLLHKSDEWLKPIKAPFAALDCTPGRGAFYPYFTLGGLDTLPSGEVVTSNGDVIPGLYAAGRTACGIPRTGACYSSGLSVGDATFTGRMAGKQAAKRK
ncbi:succinate dehydrogenase/fumarate reductase flavoprotein subunit [Sinobacterium caligoides]|uniref:Succinate dehydrogenase/fumarate reductase flavoprotein subunit n=1 Tax=Sinobacterium caligoides TaxID=933926 RepID=A0A3N2DXW2_9GAMM|nr:FAD-dependent oxidoreductase [Sinobacterium caligoides]ROS04634.1 succinate dehydrogenase/fumarate reductase flavoprotein subunit [Sinobacterium caligoides]